MSDLSGLMAQIPMADVARKLGVDEETAESAVRQALPTLVHGLSANASDPAGARSLESALPQHRRGHGTLNLDEVDEEDGDKIVSNVFGKKKPDVVREVAKRSPKADESIISKLLPILAPIVMAWLANKFLGGKDSGKSSGGGIGDVLGGLLGGGSGSSSGGLGDVLGGLLGGGKR